MKDKKDLPFTLTIREVAKILRINVGKAYELAHREDFPSLRIGNRIIVPRDPFFNWLNKEAS